MHSAKRANKELQRRKIAPNLRGVKPNQSKAKEPNCSLFFWSVLFSSVWRFVTHSMRCSSWSDSQVQMVKEVAQIWYFFNLIKVRKVSKCLLVNGFTFFSIFGSFLADFRSNFMQNVIKKWCQNVSLSLLWITSGFTLLVHSLLHPFVNQQKLLQEAGNYRKNDEFCVENLPQNLMNDVSFCNIRNIRQFFFWILCWNITKWITYLLSFFASFDIRLEDDFYGWKRIIQKLILWRRDLE